ncbi:hypothetical protein RHMOL_Rhmol12G0226900 [Rhododendron molle]|uniref:Uncharacterized protein n=1 Tax=Rhododendron molle TaxID=49168 RepID=A0ACC0LLH5_RHOML|nr:hypothetical protein RHMOL_Rhmol12G0226900 [Rhododendron molle]
MTVGEESSDKMKKPPFTRFSDVVKADAGHVGVEKYIFNCAGDRAVTHNGMAKLCAKAAGLPVEIVHYDSKAVGVDVKKAFPFRNMVYSTNLDSYIW